MNYFGIGKTTATSREDALRAGCGLLPPEFPFLYSVQSGEVIHEATAYLAQMCLAMGGRGERLVVKPSTALCRAYDLRDFLTYLRVRQVELVEMSTESLFGYAATMANRVSPQTSEIYSHLTVARRVRAAISFCIWLGKRGALPIKTYKHVQALQNDLGSDSVRNAGHRRFRGRTKATLLPTPYKLHEPRALEDWEARALLRELRSPKNHSPTDDLSDAINARNELMATIALCTGLRRAELCQLELGSFAGITLKRGEKALYPVLLIHTKNDVRRKVLFPGHLIIKAHSFIEKQRQVICTKHSACRCGLQAPVFPSIRKGRGETCKPMTAPNFGLVIREAAKRAGLVRLVQQRNASGLPVAHVEKAEISVHDLRHTYAVWTYLLLHAKGDTNPWLYIQAQLGHRSAETTINIYLRAVRMFQNEVTDRFAELIEDITTILDEKADEQI